MDDPLIRGIANAHMIRHTSLGGLLRRSRSSEIKSNKNKQTVARELELEKERHYQLKIALHSNPPTAFHEKEISKSEKSSISNEIRFDVMLPSIEVEDVTSKLPGTKSSGKTSFLNFLKSTIASSPRKETVHLSNLREDIFAPPFPRIGSFEKHDVEARIDTDRINLTLWDSEGLEKKKIGHQLQEIVSFVEGKFESTFREELKIIRTPINSQDTHIHVVFLLLDPLRIEQDISNFKSAIFHYNWQNENSEYSTFDLAGRMEEDIEIKVLRALQGKAIVLPIISKADTITSAHMTFLKKYIREKLWRANLDPLDTFETEDDDNDAYKFSNKTDIGSDVQADDGIRSPMNYEKNTSRTKSPKTSIRSSNRTDKPANYLENSALPFSIISPDLYEPDIIGRRFPWGLANPLNDEHCDFIHLKKMVFYEWREDLREVCWKILYENWRTNRFLRHVQQ